MWGASAVGVVHSSTCMCPCPTIGKYVLKRDLLGQPFGPLVDQSDPSYPVEPSS